MNIGTSSNLYAPFTIRELFKLGAAYIGLRYMPEVLGELVGPQTRYGDRRRIRNPLPFGAFREAILLANPLDIQAVLKDHGVERPDCIRHSFQMTSKKDNAFTAHGDVRKRQLKDFYDSMALKTGVANEGKLEAFVRQEIAGWPRSIDDLGDQLTILTARTLCYTFFGYDMPPDEAIAMNRAYSGGLQNNVLIGSLIRAFTCKGSESLPLLNTPQAVKVFRQITDKIIGNALGVGREHFPDNFLNKLMTSTGYWDNPCDKNAREEVAAQLTILLAGGHEAPRSMLFWALNHVARDKAVQDTLSDEARMAASSEMSEPSVKKRPFAVSVLLESMRLYPPAFVLFKTPANDVRLPDGEIIRPKTLIMLPTAVVHRDSRHYEAADEFHPYNMDHAHIKARPAGAYLTFGRGPHTCPGQGFALQFGAIVLGEILNENRLVAPNPDMPRPSSKAVIGSPAGSRLVLQRRDNSGETHAHVSPSHPQENPKAPQCPFNWHRYL